MLEYNIRKTLVKTNPHNSSYISMETLTTSPNTLICIVSLIIAAAAVVANFMSRRWSCLLSFIAFALLYFLGNVAIPLQQMWFWGTSALLGWGICVLLPAQVMHSRHGLGYIAGGALVGAFIGILISLPFIVIGSLAGAFCGALAYSRTPSGAALRFPSKQFLNYLCAKGLPAAVCMCVAALILFYSFIQNA